MQRKRYTILCIVAAFLLLAGSTVLVTDQPLETMTSDADPVTMRMQTHAYTPHAPIMITSDAGFASQGWPGNGTEANPYVIEDLNITSTSVCIGILHTRVYFEIRGCLISSAPSSSNSGIQFNNVTHGSIHDTIVEQHFLGIFLSNSPGSILTGNTARDNSYGFYLATSSLCTLMDNTAEDDSGGFFLVGSESCALTGNTAATHIIGFYLEMSGGTHMTDNDASGNDQDGFLLGQSPSLVLTNNSAVGNRDGFYIEDCGSSVLTNNTARDNSAPGFSLLSDSCSLTNNTASGNDLYGIYITGEGNLLYQNHLFHNGLSEALDDGGPNSWDDGESLGNCWGDYDGTGPYNVPGSVGNVDHYPTKSPITRPFVDNPSDLEYEIATLGHSITWNSYDTDPVSFEVYRNDSLIDSDDWTGSSIVINVDGLSRGFYNYTLFLSDALMNTNFDTVFVDVTDAPPVIAGPGDIEYDAGTTGHSISWAVTDTNPSRYEIYRNGTLIDSDDWTGSPVILGIDALELGTYNFTIVVYDTSENHGLSSVFVTVFDGTRPQMNSPLDVSYTVGETGNEITWSPFDLHPATYTVFLDDELIVSGMWNSSAESIVFSIDGLTLGLHKVQIVVTDLVGHVAMDTVYVTVLSEVTTTITTTTSTLTSQTTGTPFGDVLIIGMVGGGLVVMLLIVLVLKRRS